VVSIRDQTGSSDSAVIVVRYRLSTTVRRLQLNTTASGAGVNGNVLSFPVLVRLNNSNFDFSSAEGGGKDIRFRKANGTRLPYEIERWDSAAGAAEIWVLEDTVYGNDSSHYIELYHVDRPAIDSSNPGAVFDTANGFRGVWHLDENGFTLFDATANAYNGTRNGFQIQGAGVIGRSQVFNGNNTYTDMGNALNPGTGNFTVSAWIKRASLISWQTIIAKSNGGNPGPAYGFIFNIMTDGNINLWVANNGFNWGDPGSFNIAGNAPIIDLTNWHFVSAVVDRSSNANCRVYLDGTNVTNVSQGNIASVGNLINTVHFQIGSESDNSNLFNGSIDETIISHTARSADWIKLCYMNQKKQDALITFR
jgi:hypothetical protein